jgi:hypothetical protein
MRCVAKLCPAQVALAGLQDDLLKQGYYTQSAVASLGAAAITLRTERIDSTMKVLKGTCRFNLDLKCIDSDAWLQDDHKTGGTGAQSLHTPRDIVVVGPSNDYLSSPF